MFLTVKKCAKCASFVGLSSGKCFFCGHVDTPPNAGDKEYLEYRKGNTAKGIALIICGVLCVPLIALSLLGGTLATIFIISVAIAFFVFGAKSITGSQEGKCPYCKIWVSVKANASKYCCANCGKESVKHKDCLEVIV